MSAILLAAVATSSFLPFPLYRYLCHFNIAFSLWYEPIVVTDLKSGFAGVQVK